MNTTSKELQLESALKEITDFLRNKIGISEIFEDIDKSLKIIALKNRNYYPSIEKKIRNFTRILYETGIFRSLSENDYIIFINKINNVHRLIEDVL